MIGRKLKQIIDELRKKVCALLIGNFKLIFDEEKNKEIDGRV